MLCKSRVTINLPFDLVFIEFCFNCWCFDFQDCNFLTSMLIIGDGLRSFRTVLIFLSMTNRFPFIFVFWKYVSHLTDQTLTTQLFFSHLVVSFYKLELRRWERLRGQVMTKFVVVVDCDQLTRLPAISIFNQLFLVPLFPTIQDIGRDKMPGGAPPLSHWKSIKCHSF